MSEKTEVYTLCELCGEEDEVDGTAWCDFCNCWHCDMCWNENCHDLEEMNTPAEEGEESEHSEKY